jgi:UDP-N-acetylmuramate dehydrogenase
MSDADMKLNNPVIESGIQLSTYNSMQVSAVAEKFTEVDNISKIRALYNSGYLKTDTFYVLGDGSNSLFIGDVSKLILKVNLKGIEIFPDDSGKVIIKAGAGENWHNLVEYCVERNLGGIENLALIPGTVGAAPIQNIGAYGVELDKVFESLTAFDTEKGEFVSFLKNDCKFSYRNSLFKENEFKNRYIITDVSLKLNSRNHAVNISYYALQDYLTGNSISDPGISDVFRAVVAIRQSKLPDPKVLGNAGSFFKNPIVSLEVYNRLIGLYPDMPSFPVDHESVKIPAGWLIEKAGWKGKRKGAVGTYEKQALVIVNHGGATGKEVWQWAMNIRESVHKMFDVQLDPEVNIIGISVNG